MTAPMLAIAALYLAVGGLFAGRCRFADARPGLRGQVAVASATVMVALIWPVLAWHRARSRIAAFL